MIFRLSQKLIDKFKAGTLAALTLHENPLAHWSALRVDGGLLRSIVREATMKRKSSNTRPSSRRDDIARLEDIPNVGLAVSADLRQLGITTPADLPGRDPYAMYDDLCRITGQRHDPCLLDTFIAAVRFMEGAPKKPWWKYTAERKRVMAARNVGSQ